MKKFLILVIAASFCLSGCGNKSDNQADNSENNSYNYTASRTSSSDNINNNNSTDNNEVNNNQNKNTETELSSFSTKIYTPNDKARQNNIRITCSTLNGTIVKSRRNIFFLQYSRKSYS